MYNEFFDESNRDHFCFGGGQFESELRFTVSIKGLCTHGSNHLEGKLKGETTIYKKKTQFTNDYVKLYIGYFSNRIPVSEGIFTLENFI